MGKVPLFKSVIDEIEKLSDLINTISDDNDNIKKLSIPYSKKIKV